MFKHFLQSLQVFFESFVKNNKMSTLDLLCLKRNNIFDAIGVLTVHWLFGKHGNRLANITSQSCRSCGDILVRHLHCYV